MKIKCTVRRRAEGLLLVALSLPLLMAQGCPPPAETPITADAGPDQSVQGGQTVTLDASGSTDDDPLTFAWTQTAGTSVTLNNADGAQATFTAPNVSETLTFQVTVSDGDEQDSDTVNIIVTSQALNQAPTANAGADQTVDTGAAVTMDGSASSDPDGDTLSYSWTQTAGTTVTLSGANTATATFTAPNTTETLTFQVSVSDGQGGSDTDAVNVNVNVTQATAPMLYITNTSGNNVTAYDITDPNTVNGNIAPDANLSGAQTQFDSPSDLVIDAGGALLVSNFSGDAITGYDDAINRASINGNIAPTRNVQGPATLLRSPTSLAVNTANDLAFVSDIVSDEIYVFANASTASFNGNLGPTRTIESADINDPFGLNFGANDELYVANNGTKSVAVFANASTVNGNVAATRTLTSGTFANLYDVYIDSNDTAYVVSDDAMRVDMFFNASTLNGAVTPDVSLIVEGADSLTAIAVDSNGTAYIVDFTANAVYSYDNITTRNGTLPPDRTLQGENTQLVGPIRVWLQE